MVTGNVDMPDIPNDPFLAGFYSLPKDVYYARGQICESERTIYDRLYEEIVHGNERMTLEAVDGHRVGEIYFMLLDDHPELYWLAHSAQCYGVDFASRGVSRTVLANVGNAFGRISGGSQRLNKAQLSFQPENGVVEHSATLSAQICQAVLSITSQAPTTASQYALAKYTFDTVVERVSYCYAPSSGVQECSMHNVIGSLIDGVAVCDGISSGVQIVLQHLGIQAFLVRGTLELDERSERHAWLLAKIDGEYCYLDPTLGLQNCDGVPPRLLKDVSHRYFGLTDAEMKAAHTPDASSMPLPVCRSKQNDYFRREQVYFTTWDMDKFSRALKQRVLLGYNSCEAKFASFAEYEEALRCFQSAEIVRAVEMTGIAGKLNHSDQYYWYKSDETRTVTIVLD